ncbi:unnamed protein product [Rhodiola kirilowii]
MDVVEWGTWEELILVSAVLRHGTCQWEAVVAELRARTLVPGRFTAEACKEKYEHLQRHYSTCSDLLEELRKHRIEELRRTLVKSDGSIGFLQTKLHTLKAEKEHSSSVDYQSSPFESPVQRSMGQSSGKEASKDGLSAGSYTQEISKIWSPPFHVPVTPVGEAQTKPRVSSSSKLDAMPIAANLGESIQTEWGISIKKIRGKRKRRGFGQDVNEENVDEMVLDSVNLNRPLLSRIKFESTSKCTLASSPHVTSQINQCTEISNCNEMMRIFDMISSNEYASIFRRRLDSQKRARYRMIIRQHMDLDVIKCRIDKRAITSTKELFRDLLLLATNGAIFYSRNTREHKYAVILRGLIKKLIMEYKRNSIPSRSPAAGATSLASANAPRISLATTQQKKLVRANPSNRNSPEKMNINENISKGAKKPCKSKDSHPTKTSSQSRKVNCQTHSGKDGSKVSRQQPRVKFPIVNEHNLKDASKQQHWTKLASVNAHTVKDEYRQQPPAKMASVTSTNACNGKDVSRQQPHAKSATVNDSKERKRARKNMKLM